MAQLTENKITEFIFDNLEADPVELLLNPPSAFKKDIDFIATQIISRKKAQGKLPEWASNRSLVLPPPVSIEQASSAITSQYKKTLMRGRILVDLTGGTGIDCLALSESFSESHFVEADRALCELFKKNSKALGHNIHIVNDDAVPYSKKFEGKAHFYVDPSRRFDSQKRVFLLEDCQPNLTSLIPILLPKARKILVKLSPLLDIHYLQEQFSNIEAIHILAVKSNCKELLVLIDPAFTGDAKIIASNQGSEQGAFTFQSREENLATSTYSAPGKYIYEPNVAILKAGAFKLISDKFKLDKLAPQTHLYTSEKRINRFPGKVFEIIHAKAKRHLKKYAMLNVISRNYPLSATELKKRWNIKDGGLNYLLAYTDHHKNKHLTIARRIS
ncbi:MAG: class I SAM-dependent methyltransferase [Bacteroidota bacterium]